MLLDPSSTLSPPAPVQERLSTGISGLDSILGGGLPADHLYLIEGTPGAGKTTLALQFLIAGAAKGEAGLYITLSETKRELETVAAAHGWSLHGVEVHELVPLDGLGAATEQSILHPAELELGETIDSVIDVVDRTQARRVVFDSLSEMRILAQNPLRYRRQVLALKSFFVRRRCTALLLDDRTSTESDSQLHSIAHGVLALEQSVEQYGPERRRLRIVKLRGIRYRGGEHDVALDTGGLVVYPRIVAAEHRLTHDGELVGTGVAALDKLLGGGVARGSNTLLCGPSGVGKTTTAIACALAALNRGERVAYYLFDENLNTLLSRAEKLGMSLSSAIERGRFTIQTLDPAEVSPGRFANMVSDAVESGVSTVVIDSLNGYMQAMQGEKHLILQMHELLAYLNQRNVVTLMILGQPGVLGNLRSEIDLSYLSDTMLLFRFFEARGSLLKAVSAVKSRASDHETTIRQFRLVAGRGVEVGPAITDFDGIIGGVTSYRGRMPMLSDSDAGIAFDEAG